MKTLTMAEAINAMINGCFIASPFSHGQTHIVVRDQQNKKIAQITHNCYYAIIDCMRPIIGYKAVLKFHYKYGDVMCKYMTINGDSELFNMHSKSFSEQQVQS